MSEGAIIAAALLGPCVGALAVLATGRWPNLRDSLSSVATLFTFAMVVQLVRPVLDGARPGLELFEVLPGVAIAFEVEPLGMLFGLVASGLWILTSLYAVGYMRGHHEENQTRFFVFFAVAISAALGIAFARNLFTLFLFYELLTFSTFPLVTHHGTDAARRSGRVYLGILVSTSVGFLLLALMWTWYAAGTLEFRPGGIVAGKVSPAAIPFLLALFAFGTGKAALMPFHRWLPAAMVAPTPVSALLHAVAVVKAGVFTVLKIVVYIFGLETLRRGDASLWLMYVAGFTIIAASVVALTQDNLKARLAYSTVSQLAYIVLGAALATASGVLGGGMHIAMHAVGKITLFFCAGAVYVATHKTEVTAMNGIGRRMPFTMGAFFIGSLSIIGLPPLGGAWSKWYLALGAAEGHHLVFMAVLMLSSLLSIGYLMPVVVRAFLCAEDEDTHANCEAHVSGEAHGDGDTRPHHSPTDRSHTGRWKLREAPLLCVLPLCISALGCVLLFFGSGALRALLLPITGAP